VLCDKQTKAETLLQNREKGQTPVLKTIVVMDSFDEALVTRGAQCGVDVLSMEELEVRSATGSRLHLGPLADAFIQTDLQRVHLLKETAIYHCGT